MPNARTHDAITVVTAGVFAPIAYVVSFRLTNNADEAALNTLIFAVAHLLSGIMFSPDLDLDSSIDDRWGIFFWIWRPYMWAVPHRHRWLSHGLIVSALIRLVYFYAVVVLLLFGITWLLGLVGVVFPTYYLTLTNYLLNLHRLYPAQVYAFLVGFITGGAVHTIADWLVTGGKRYLRRVGIRVTADYSDHDRGYGRRSRWRSRSW